MNERAVNAKPIDKWIPWFFVLFFIVIATLDGIFVTLALRTHTGTVTENAFEKGVAYNNVLKEARERDALGWNADITLGDDNNLIVSLRGKDGSVLKGARVSVKMVRPAQDGYDYEITLTDEGNGLYAAPANLPLPGQWQARIFATWQDKRYQISKTIIAQ